MATDIRKMPVVIGLVFALLIPVAQAAGGQNANESLVPKAVAFVRTLAKGDFQAAEADFTDQMKQAAPPETLRKTWQSLIDQVGPFQGTGDSKAVVHGEYTFVIVRTDFKSRALGIRVVFDSAQKIAGMQFVGPP